MRRLHRDGRGQAGGDEAVALIGRKEEQFVLDERAAESAAKLIEPYFLLLYTRLIVEEVVGIERVVADELEHAAVEGVGSRLAHQVGDGAGAVAILRAHVQRELLEFLH